MSAPTTPPREREQAAGHVRPDDFRHRAACTSVDPAVFFPVPGRRHATAVRTAKAVCAGCPVRDECLSWALSALPDGIAGGLTEDERRTERGRRARARRGARPGPERVSRRC